MIFRNTTGSYGLIAKSLHWIAAALIFTLLSVGFFMTEMEFSPAKLQIYGLHKSFGITVLILVVIRALWRFGNPKVRELETHQRWEKILAHITHALLYVALFVMPLSGWLMSSAGDFPATFFGLFDLPPLVEKNEKLFKILQDFHELMAFAILGVVALHMAGAFKHHILDRDETLQRMTTPRLGLIGGLALAAVAGIVWIAPVFFAFNDDAAEAVSTEAPEEAVEDQAELAEDAAEDAAEHAGITEWDLDEEASVIAFLVQQSGGNFEGRFEDFDADIYFDPEKLEQSTALVEIKIDSLKTGSEERDGQARSAEWFDAGTHPKAVFKSESFTRTEPNRYAAAANLTIRGVTIPVRLDFTLNIDEIPDQGRIARMDGELTLNRLDFGIGQGQWQGTETIGNPVKITLHVEAKAQSGHGG